MPCAEPAATGMRDWYDTVPSNPLQCRLSTGESCRVVDRWSMAE